jgi:hypothetical protein
MQVWQQGTRAFSPSQLRCNPDLVAAAPRDASSRDMAVVHCLRVADKLANMHV